MSEKPKYQIENKHGEAIGGNRSNFELTVKAAQSWSDYTGETCYVSGGDIVGTIEINPKAGART
jgi:hypothetical protein